MKRMTIISGIFFTFCAMSSFAGPGGITAVGLFWDITGVESGVGANASGAGLSLMFGNFPVIGVSYNFTPPTRLAGFLDGFIVHNVLGGPVWWHLALGGFFGATFHENPNTTDFDIGARLPVGLEIHFLERLEVYVEIIPLVRFYPAINPGLGAALGFRVHV